MKIKDLQKVNFSKYETGNGLTNIFRDLNGSSLHVEKFFRSGLLKTVFYVKVFYNNV